MRNFWRKKAYSLLNLFGLAVGIACCLAILQYVNYERSFDRFHENGEQIVRLRLDHYQEGKLAWSSATVYPAFAPTMKKELPEVVEACRLHDAEYVMTNPENNVRHAERKGYFADPAVLTMFTIDLMSGDAVAALARPNSIVLSESMARKYFGSADALGRSLVVKDPDFFQTFEVTGVFRDYPENSHLRIDYLVSYRTLANLVAQVWGDTTNATETAWGWYDFYTYLQLSPGTDLAAFKSKVDGLVDRHVNSRYRERNLDNMWGEIHLIPMPDIHLHSRANQEAEENGDGRAVSLLLIVGFFVLFIAWINYINLATARASERAREVGVRKVLGAARPQLVGQFLAENFIMNLAAFALALVLVSLSAPAFSRFIGVNIPFSLGNDPGFWIAAASVFLLGTLLSGLYPAFVLSGFRPVVVLHGQPARSLGGMLLRKGLIIFQFVASIALIVATITVFRQVHFMRSQDLGVNLDGMLVLEGPNTVLDSLYEDVYQPFKNEVEALAEVRHFTASAYVPGDEIYWTAGSRWLGSGNDNFFTLFTQGADEEFLDAYELSLVAGRNFSRQFGEDDRACLLNESAVKLLGMPDPEQAVGQMIVRGRDTLRVAGVTSDFHHLGLHRQMDPMIFLYSPDSRSYYSIKVESSNLSGTLAAIQKRWEAHFPDDPFSYFFLDEFYNRQYRSDISFGKVFALFSCFAILVACLGLLGLASFQVLQRTKEIGIRKVLGASVSQIVNLLSKDFVRLVILAILIASPIAWWVMDRWLDTFAFRISISWWIFVLAGSLAVGIALTTVTLQSLRTAMADPVKALRDE